MKRFEEAVRQPHCHLLVDLKATTPEHQRMKANIFTHQPDVWSKVDEHERFEANLFQNANNWMDQEEPVYNKLNNKESNMEEEDTVSLISTVKRRYQEDPMFLRLHRRDEDGETLGPPGTPRYKNIKSTKQQVWIASDAPPVI